MACLGKDAKSWVCLKWRSKTITISLSKPTQGSLILLWVECKRVWNSNSLLVRAASSVLKMAMRYRNRLRHLVLWCKTKQTLSDKKYQSCGKKKIVHEKKKSKAFVMDIPFKLVPQVWNTNKYLWFTKAFSRINSLSKINYNNKSFLFDGDDV